MCQIESDVFLTVREVLIEALEVEEDEVSPEALLTKDLDCEDIDWLDILFRLEKKLKIRFISNIGTFFTRHEIWENPQYCDNNQITADGLLQFRELIPYATDTLASLKVGLKLSAIFDLFTVADLCRLVMHYQANHSP